MVYLTTSFVLYFRTALVVVLQIVYNFTKPHYITEQGLGAYYSTELRKIYRAVRSTILDSTGSLSSAIPLLNAILEPSS